MMPLKFRSLSVVPVISVGAYASGQQIGGLNTLSHICDSSGGAVKIDSIVLVDGAKQKQPVDLFFFGAKPALTSADTQAFDLPDAEMAKCIGVINVVASEYSDSSSNSVACKHELGLIGSALAGAKNLYVVIVSRGAPTYGAANALTLVVGVTQ